MIVILQHCPNVDIMHDERRGYWRPVSAPPFQAVKVATLAEAADRVRQFVKGTGIGCGNFGRNCGNVLCAAGDRIVARVSYNGRVWTPAQWPEAVELAV